MTVNVGDTVTAAQYNNLQQDVALILGDGNDTFGYGQSLASSTVSIGTTINASHMNVLKTDLDKISYHQLNVVATGLEGVNLDVNNTGNIIKAGSTGDAIARTFNDYTQAIANLDTNSGYNVGSRFTAHPTQMSLDTIQSIQGPSSWNGTIDSEQTITFAGASGSGGAGYNARRYFFNAGGEIRFSATLSHNGSNKSRDWADLLSAMGTIKFNHTETVCTGTGTGSNIGVYDLSTSYTTIFEKSGGINSYGVNYSENKYIIQARFVGTTEANQIQFNVILQDNDTGDPNYDEDVGGTLNVYIQSYRAVGSHVAVDSPSISMGGF